MTKHETERIEKLTYADLAAMGYRPNVEDHYGKASHERMRELMALLLKAKDGGLCDTKAISGT
jgi:hypothetical protein